MARQKLTSCKLTPHQLEALQAVEKSSDGWITRGASRIWGIAPTAIYALTKKGLLEMHRSRDRARLTPAGSALLTTLTSEVSPL